MNREKLVQSTLGNSMATHIVGSALQQRNGSRRTGGSVGKHAFPRKKRRLDQDPCFLSCVRRVGVLVLLLHFKRKILVETKTGHAQSITFFSAVRGGQEISLSVRKGTKQPKTHTKRHVCITYIFSLGFYSKGLLQSACSHCDAT